ncbi:MAG TPA: Rieske (2Fe-2S) protein, partial [Pilimelia sp.]|nr:Rieske (2Fe-2S) protein [Pilimelia sp.]
PGGSVAGPGGSVAGPGGSAAGPGGSAAADREAALAEAARPGTLRRPAGGLVPAPRSSTETATPQG